MSSSYFLQLFSFALLLNILTSNKAPLLQLLVGCGEREGSSPSGSARRGIAIAGINIPGRQFFTSQKEICSSQAANLVPGMRKAVVIDTSSMPLLFNFMDGEKLQKSHLMETSHFTHILFPDNEPILSSYPLKKKKKSVALMSQEKILLKIWKNSDVFPRLEGVHLQKGLLNSKHWSSLMPNLTKNYI